MPHQTEMYQSKPRIHKNIYFGYLVCTIGALFYCYEFILRIIPGALQSELSAAFGYISAATFGQLSAFYYFAYSPMQLPVGMLMDRFGPRRLLTFACLCCTFGSYLFTFTASIFIAGLGRFLVGFGSSFAFVGVLSLAMQWLPRKYFSLAAGLITTLGMLGLVYGEVKITTMVITSGLQSVLFSMVILGAILSFLTFLIVRDAPGVRQTKTLPWPNFFRDVAKVLMSGEVWLIGTAAACLYTSLSIFGELWGKTYLEQVHHLTKTEAAKSISVLFLGWAVGAPIAGYLSDITGRRVLSLVVGALMALVCISFILYYPGLPYIWLNCLIFLYGLFSGTEIVAFIMAKENTGAQLTGTVFAAINMIVTLGGVVFQPLVGKLLDKLGNGETTGGEFIYSTIDYQVALSILPISLLTVTIIAFFLKDKHTMTE